MLVIAVLLVTGFGIANFAPASELQSTKQSILATRGTLSRSEFIQLYDLGGRLVASADCFQVQALTGARARVKLSQLAAGVYIVVFRDCSNGQVTWTSLITRHSRL